MRFYDFVLLCTCDIFKYFIEHTHIRLKYGVIMSNNSKRVQVVFTNEQYEIIQKLKGLLGNSDSEVVKNITLNWLSDNSILSSVIVQKVLGEDKDEI